MSSTGYKHSAYWYAKNYGWTYSEATTYAERYLDYHTNLQSGKLICGFSYSGENAPEFNPLIFAACAMVDIGQAVARDVKKITDPKWRKAQAEEFRQELRILRRPFYYARENERRRALAAERRKLKRRTTTAPMPTPEAILDAWNHRKDSKDAMIRLGGMLQDLECYVDNCLCVDFTDKVVGRNGGIRGWLRDNLPEIAPHYKTLMRYKAMAIRLRQATGTKDPVPTEKLLSEKVPHKVLIEIREESGETFAAIEKVLKHHLLATVDEILRPKSDEIKNQKLKPDKIRK